MIELAVVAMSDYFRDQQARETHTTARTSEGRPPWTPDRLGTEPRANATGCGAWERSIDGSAR